VENVNLPINRVSDILKLRVALVRAWMQLDDSADSEASAKPAQNYQNHELPKQLQLSKSEY